MNCELDDENFICFIGHIQQISVTSLEAHVTASDHLLHFGLIDQLGVGVVLLQHLGQLCNSKLWLLVLILDLVERCHITLVLVREADILVSGEEVPPKLGIFFHEFRNGIFITIFLIIKIEVYDRL